jgi:hypothetical protein
MFREALARSRTGPGCRGAALGGEREAHEGCVRLLFITGEKRERRRPRGAVALLELSPGRVAAIGWEMPTIQAMKDWKTTFIVPIGVGAHLESWGVPADSIVELDWWERTRLGDVEVVATPARHASGRSPFVRQNGTLWAGFAFIGPSHRAYYSGDTGFFPGLDDIGARLGPFDLAMIESGAYGRSWPDWRSPSRPEHRARCSAEDDALVGRLWAHDARLLPRMSTWRRSAAPRARV